MDMENYNNLRCNLSWLDIDIEKINEIMEIAKDIMTKSKIMQGDKNVTDFIKWVDQIDIDIRNDINYSLQHNIDELSYAEIVAHCYFKEIAMQLQHRAWELGLDDTYFDWYKNNDYIVATVYGDKSLYFEINSGSDVDKCFNTFAKELYPKKIEELTADIKKAKKRLEDSQVVSERHEGKDDWAAKWVSENEEDIKYLTTELQIIKKGYNEMFPKNVEVDNR